MWRLLAILVLCLPACGCTHLRLQKTTVDQGSTLTGMQQQLVLDNLAMFACNPHAVAWHVRVTGGLAQVSDQGGGFLSGLFITAPQVITDVGVQRNVLDQWNLQTVIEPDDLQMLQIAYQKAITPFDPDGSIRRLAFEKISEMSCEFHIVLKRDIVRQVIDCMRFDASDAEKAELNRIEGLLMGLYDRLEAESVEVEKFEPQTLVHQGMRMPSELEFVREEIIKLVGGLNDDPIIPRRTPFRTERNIGLIEQAQGKIAALVELVALDEPGKPNPFSTPWLGHACRKKDIPCNACLVGHYKGCEGECYVYVLPDRRETFRDFMLLLLGLVPPDAQDNAPPAAGVGAAFSPNL